MSRHKSKIVLLIAVLLLCPAICNAQSIDSRILQKALVKALGEKTNMGISRLVVLEQKAELNEKILLVGVAANDSPTPTGIRHGIYKDVVTVLSVLRSWGWPSKVDKAMVAGYYAESKGPNTELRPVLMCIVSSDTLRKYDWKKFDPSKLPVVADGIQIDDMLVQNQ